MLNYRRRTLLRKLLQPNPGGYVSVEILAEELSASEKTIRTDLKALDSWLAQYPDIHIVRKPGFGVCLEATVTARRALTEALKGKKSFQGFPKKTLRKQMLLELLLQRETVITTQKLAEKLYVSKPAIRHELKEVSHWLKDFQLKLVKKPNVGLQIEGNERNWRQALAELFSNLVLHGDITNEILEANRLINEKDLILLEGLVRELQGLIESDFTDDAVRNLVIHLAIAFKRIRNKRVIVMSEKEAGMVQESVEFKWALTLSDRIKKTFAITLPASEVAYIGLHFMGAKRQSLTENDPEAFSLSIQMVRDVERLILQPLGKDHELITGIAIHLHSALVRLRHGLGVKNPLLAQIKEMYRYPFEALALVVPGVVEPVGLTFPEDEIGYLTLHFQAALERLHRNRDNSVRTLLVCSTGTGTSRLLSSRLTRIFRDIHVVHVTSLFRLDEGIRSYQPDVIISTVSLPCTTVPSVTVSALFPESDQLKVEAFLKSMSSAGKQYSTIVRMTIPDLVFLDLDCTDKLQVMAFLADKLTEFGYTDSGYRESTWSRERISSTAIGGGIAIPHGESRYIRKSGIAIARLQHPLVWENEEVWFVLMLAITFENRTETERLFREMADLVDDESVLSVISTITTVSELISCLEGRIAE